MTISKTLTLYAVYKKLPYTVTFNNNNGTSTSKIYTSLTMYASKNQKVTLPDVPKVKGYTNLGWTTEKGETEPEYSAGDTVKITKQLSSMQCAERVIIIRSATIWEMEALMRLIKNLLRQ